MSSRIFIERIHRLLDKADMPLDPAERAESFAIIFGLPKTKSRAILGGFMRPPEQLLDSIATEFEVKKDWLIGERH